MDNLSEEFMDKVYDEGEVVFSHYWDSRTIGPGADTEYVYQYDGAYYAHLSSEGVLFGPYETLEQALIENELTAINDSTVSIECERLDNQKLQSIFYGMGGPLEHSFKVNQQLWKANMDGSIGPVETN